MEQLSDLVKQIENWLSDGGRQNGASNSKAETDILKNLREIIGNDRQLELADYIAINPKSIGSLFSFATCIFKGLTTGQSDANSDLVACLGPILHCLICWTDKSQHFRTAFLAEGLIFDCIDMLNKLGGATQSKFVSFLVTMNIGIIYNCAREELFRVYRNKIVWAGLLQHWMKSSNPAIKLYCMFLLGFLVPYLSESDLTKLMPICAREHMKSVIHLLKSSSLTATLTAECHGNVFSADEILLNILNLIHLSTDNYDLLLDSELLQPCVSLLQKGSGTIIPLTCQLLWGLCSDNSFRQIAFDNPSLNQEVDRLCQSAEPNVKLIGKCLQISMRKENLDLELALVYIEGCYKYKQYQKCVDEVERQIAATNGDSNMKLNLVKGKALFQLYRKEKLCLLNNTSTMAPQHFFTAHDACFSKLKEIILLLGDLLDHNQLDEEGSRMLDFAMMDCICEINKLYECHRCYLCRENLATRMKLSDKGAAKSTGKKEKLIASHIYPKAILDRFASAVPLPKNKKIFDNLLPGLGRQSSREQPASAKESSVYMLCQKCEDSLSKHGENWFITHFFDKLYDKDSRDKSHPEQILEYGYQLYMFSIGIIFRAFNWDFDAYVNSDECYQLFKYCRSCLLNPKSLPDIEIKPEIYLLMSPLRATEEDLRFGFMNQVLTSTCNLNTACFDLETGKLIPKTSVKAHFLIVHIGMINFLVKFSPCASVSIPNDYLINPEGGRYLVPVEENRRKILPIGVWAAFEFMAKEFEQSWYEHLNKPCLSIEKQDKILPEANIADSYGIVSGMLQELALMTSEPSKTPEDGEPKVVNLLPNLFHIRSKQLSDDVVLPEGHRILLHQTFQQNAQSITLFIAVGQTDNFSLEKPYVLWHTFKAGSQKNFAFFISTEDLHGTELVMGNKEKFFVINPDIDMEIAMKLTAPKLLKTLLRNKGYYSIKSLLYAIKSRDIFSTDVPCEAGCWYCSIRCRNCLQLSVPEYTMVTKENETASKFCSKECQNLFALHGNDIATAMFIVTASGKVFGLNPLSDQSTFTFKPKCSPISKHHSKLLHMFIQAESSKGFLVQKQLALCISDGSEGVKMGAKYITEWSRSLLSQNILEYYVADDYSPTTPLDYLTQEAAAVEFVEKIKCQGNHQVYLQRAMQALKEFETMGQGTFI